jgi:hypothetical protein
MIAAGIVGQGLRAATGEEAGRRSPDARSQPDPRRPTMAGAALAWRVLGLGTAIGASVVARKVATSTWKVATGNDPPANPEDPETTWREAMTWAVASGAMVGVVRMLATRKAADYWQKSTGKLPPGIEKVS